MFFRALVLSMVEILFSCGNKKRAVVATLNVFGDCHEDVSEDAQKNEVGILLVVLLNVAIFINIFN